MKIDAKKDTPVVYVVIDAVIEAVISILVDNRWQRSHWALITEFIFWGGARSSEIHAANVGVEN